ncbi:hypothetical protein PMAYCL1PPCAC_08975, partial [Pristionchus mayeri]
MADAILLSDLLVQLGPLLSVDSPDLADALKLLPAKLVLLLHENEGLRAEKAQHKMELDKMSSTFKTALALKNRKIKDLEAENEQLRGSNEEVLTNEKKRENSAPSKEVAKNEKKKKKKNNKKKNAALPTVVEPSTRVVNRLEPENTAARSGAHSGEGRGCIDVPNPLNLSGMQSYFLQEVQL